MRSSTHTALRLAATITLLAFAGAACGEKAPSRARKVAVGPAPDSFQVSIESTRGTFEVEVIRAWSPRGADRFRDLVAEAFFDESAFFRVLPGFVAQFGVNDDRKRNEQWDAKPVHDDSVKHSNTRGTLVFALDGPNSRSHQLFINLVDNARLDRQGFAPIGRVIRNMAIVDSIYSGYGERPNYHLLATLGNSYLRRMFPKIDYIKSAKIVSATSASPGERKGPALASTGRPRGAERSER